MTARLFAAFFSATPVFRRAEFARVVGHRSSDWRVSALLAQHVRAGQIKRLARGLYASVPEPGDLAGWRVDRFLVASRLRPQGVFAYRSAVEAHGYAGSSTFDLQMVAPGKRRSFKTSDFVCHFVRPGAPLGSDSVTAVEQDGRAIPVTTLERTVADLFDRPDLAGGPEDLLNSLDLIAGLDGEKFAQHLKALDNAAAAGAVSWWLAQRRTSLRIPDTALTAIRALAAADPLRPRRDSRGGARGRGPAECARSRKGRK